MDAAKKLIIKNIYKDIREIEEEELNAIIKKLNIRNPEEHVLSGKNMLLLKKQAEMRESNIIFSVVAGFKQWQKHSRKVKKGEKGFYIAIPSRKADDETNDEADTETFFFYKAVFDISQTEEIK